jgi:hypothetical protein
VNDLTSRARPRAARHGRHVDGRERPWFDVSAAVLEISRRAVKRARIELVVLLPLLASVLAALVKQADVQSPSTQIHSSVQHEAGPPPGRSSMTR